MAPANTFCAERNTEEERAAREQGLRFLKIGVIDNTAPRQAQLREFVDFVADPAAGSVYAHCEAGVGRTGVFVAAYRMALEGWPAGKAIAEARRFGLRLRSQKRAALEFGLGLRTR